MKMRLAIVPVLMVVLGFWVSALRGPFYYGDVTDPEYAYLFNAVNVLTLKSPGHIDHPGTTLQVGLAGVVLARHVVGCASGDDCKTLPIDVLSNPEPYLRAANFVLVVGIGLMLYILGVFVWRQTGVLAAALVLQGMLFSFPIVLQSMGG